MLLSGGVALSACNTTEGVGEDIEAAGDAIDDAAEDAQE
ncbi:MAG: entericidin A/B family lipoprotein [Dongiaceae bacterium]